MTAARPAALLPGRPAGRAALAGALALLAWAHAPAAGPQPAWVSAWADDLLAIPLVLVLVLAAHRLAGRPASWCLPRRHGLAVAVAYAVFFELVLPRLDPAAVGDPVDAGAYLVGWALFETLLNVPGRALATASARADDGTWPRPSA